MTIRADFCISRAQYNQEHSHIIQVEARQVIGDLLAHPQIMSRTKVIELIKASLDFVTAKELLKDQWVRGEDVNLVNVDGSDFLRIDHVRACADDLGELQEY